MAYSLLRYDICHFYRSGVPENCKRNPLTGFLRVLRGEKCAMVSGWYLVCWGCVYESVQLLCHFRWVLPLQNWSTTPHEYWVEVALSPCESATYAVQKCRLHRENHRILCFWGGFLVCRSGNWARKISIMQVLVGVVWSKCRVQVTGVRKEMRILGALKLTTDWADLGCAHPYRVSQNSINAGCARLCRLPEQESLKAHRCQNLQAVRPEGAEAHSPGQRPGYNGVYNEQCAL